MRKQLSEGTVPQVYVVFGYLNPQAPRIPDEEYVRLKDIYGQMDCPNMVKFLEAVNFEEKARNVTMSYNLSMGPRINGGHVSGVVVQQAIMRTPDILVGTRDGVEGAWVWFRNMYEYFREEVVVKEYMESIFGEALLFVLARGHELTQRQFVDLALNGGPLPGQDVSEH